MTLMSSVLYRTSISLYSDFISSFLLSNSALFVSISPPSFACYSSMPALVESERGEGSRRTLADRSPWCFLWTSYFSVYVLELFLAPSSSSASIRLVISSASFLIFLRRRLSSKLRRIDWASASDLSAAVIFAW